MNTLKGNHGVEMVARHCDPKPAGLPVIVGPTCVGKTGITQQLVDEYPLEVINMDSFQVYEHFVIGTGRSHMTLPHRHLYGFLNPLLKLSSDEYIELAGQAIDRLLTNGNLPIFEGGSLTFLRALWMHHPLQVVGILPFSQEWIETQVERRMDRRFEADLLNEIEAGLALGYRHTRVMMDDVVYLPLVRYLDGEISIDQARTRIKDNLLRMNARQMADYDDFDIEWVFPTSALRRLRQVMDNYLLVADEQRHSQGRGRR